MIVNSIEDGFAIDEEPDRIVLDFSTVGVKSRARIKRSAVQRCISSYNRDIRATGRIDIRRVSRFSRGRWIAAHIEAEASVIVPGCVDHLNIGFNSIISGFWLAIGGRNEGRLSVI